MIQSRQRYGVVARGAKDIFDEDIMTAEAQVNAVLIARLVGGLELDIGDAAVGAMQKIQGPVALFDDLQASHLKMIYVSHEDHVVVEDVREAVLERIALAKAVVYTTVQNRAVLPDDRDVFLVLALAVKGILGRKNTAVYAVSQAEMGAVQRDFLVAVQYQRAIDDPNVIVGQGVVTRDHNI